MTRGRALPAAVSAHAADSAEPLRGKTVLLVHPAWHTCGSYQVNVSQVAAYKSLGARVISVAVMDAPGPAWPSGARWRAYSAGSSDLDADRRFFTGATVARLATPSLLKDGWWPLIHGDQATWLIEQSRRAPIPAGLETESIDLVHANHFFVMPFVERLLRKKRAPVILDSHDVQAQQFALRNREGFFIPPHVSLDEMLAIELSWMRRADVCAHLTDCEYRTFGALLPRSTHVLLYPAVREAARAVDGQSIVTVASDNYPNYLSLEWLLEEVMTRVPGVAVDIYGGIDEGVWRRRRILYEANEAWFRGSVPDVASIYADAACVLLPSREGYGLSIKTVEALSSGAPLIATRHAFRGMGFDPSKLANVVIADDAESFVAALRAVVTGLEMGARIGVRAACDTRRVYEQLFSPQAYIRKLAEIAAPLTDAASG